MLLSSNWRPGIGTAVLLLHGLLALAIVSSAGQRGAAATG